jgi:hypothetical protein
MSDEGTGPVVVLLNFSGNDVEAVADLPDDTAASFGDGELTDLWSGELVPAAASGRVAVAVPGWGWRFLTRTRGL